MFFGNTFASMPTAISNSTSIDEKINKISLSGMILDELYATKDVLLKFNWQIPDGWDFNTLLHAKYQNSTHAGNVGFSESIVSKTKIKKRFKGDFAWKTIYEKEVHDNKDFAIEFYDRLNPAKKYVEYAYVPVIAGSDSNTNIVSADVYSDFRDDMICERDVAYPLILDVDNTITYNRESSTVVSPGRKYPYIVNNGIAQYYSGTYTVTFIELKDCRWDTEKAYAYRNQLDQFLANGKAKILKTTEGDIWMINVVGSISRSNDGPYHVTQSFDWAEAGNPTSIADLYDNGFIDTDVDRE